MEKIKVNQVIVVEGKYDAIKLDSFVDGLIIAVNGFSIFRDDEKKQLLKQLGQKNGIILLTDSDSAGFKIRTYIQNICRNAQITDVYIPQVKGKESRKSNPSKEGTLGVEGIDKQTLLRCFRDAGITEAGFAPVKKSGLTYVDLFELGLSGTDNATQNREKVCKTLNIPTKLSKKSFLEVLNRMTDRQHLENILCEKPTLFWDFHGTLTLHLHQWTDCAYQLIHDNFPQYNVTMEKVCDELDGQCLPWYTNPDRDTRHLLDIEDGWWKSCNAELIKMFMRCGLTQEEATSIHHKVREYLIAPENNPLYDGIKDVLQTLKDRGYKHYLVSNNYPELDVLMDQLGLTQYFEAQIISGKIGFDKPRKEIFEYALQVAGNPAERYMIGDNLKDDVHGSKACGFKTVFIDLRGNRSDDKCDHTVYNVQEIPDIFK
ncbi:MAG: HAD-IA family hydrolase [Oscillospiraceae bacterium]|nr:HAD-IA family hydrolase [Oscillospiraceae bacterium]